MLGATHLGRDSTEGASVCGGMASHVEAPTCYRTCVSSVDTQTDFYVHPSSAYDQHYYTHDTHARRDAAVHSMDSLGSVLHLLVSHLIEGRRRPEGGLSSDTSSLPHVTQNVDAFAGGEGERDGAGDNAHVDTHHTSKHHTTHSVSDHLATDSPSGDGASPSTNTSSLSPLGVAEDKVADVSRLLRVPITFARHLTRVVLRELAVLGVSWETSVLPEDTRHGARPVGEVLAHHLLRRRGRGSGRRCGGALSASAFIFNLEKEEGEIPVLRARRRVPLPQVTESTATLRDVPAVKVSPVDLVVDEVATAEPTATLRDVPAVKVSPVGSVGGNQVFPSQSNPSAISCVSDMSISHARMSTPSEEPREQPTGSGDPVSLEGTSERHISIIHHEQMSGQVRRHEGRPGRGDLANHLKADPIPEREEVKTGGSTLGPGAAVVPASCGSPPHRIDDDDAASMVAGGVQTLPVQTMASSTEPPGRWCGVGSPL